MTEAGGCNANKKLPKLRPMFHVGILLNGQTYFNASFASLEDMLDRKIWDAGTSELYNALKKWADAQEESDET